MATQRIGSNRITDSSITGDKITNYSVTADKLSNTAITDKLGYTPGNADLVTSAYNQANGAFAQANVSAETLETVSSRANAAYTAANAAVVTADIASQAIYDQYSRDLANTANTTATTAYNLASNVSSDVTSALTAAENAYAAANSAVETADATASGAADTYARNHANGAFDAANTAYSASGGSISGNVTISDTSYTFSQSESNYATHRYVLHGETTDATETEIFVGGVSNSRIPVGANTSVSADIQMTARRTDVTGESAGWNLKVACDNFNGTVADSGNVYEIIVHTDDANYLVDARADDTNDSLNIYVTGVAAKNISWAAVVTTVEVSQ